VKILVYDDNPDYGGHQVMASLGIKALAEKPDIEIVCMINPANRRLSDRLAQFQCVSPSANLQALEPDLVLCIQGDTTQCLQGIRSARQAGIACVSYIAIPHTLKRMGAKFGAFRDRFYQSTLNYPDRYIVISESMKQLLINRGTTKPISIVPNGIPAPAKMKKTVHSSRLTLGMIGRIEFKQKQQNFMLQTFLDHPAAFESCRLLIAGNGPDQKKLKAMAGKNKNIEILSWQDDLDTFYSRIDFLMLPSRFEGVPLVMLEALARGIPVIGSARDGMKDILPEPWTFEPENAQALADTFSSVRKNWKNEISPLQQNILKEYSLDAFKADFVNAVTGH
jgi:glycosyltransferase involved in cell wall biosynthesis